MEKELQKFPLSNVVLYAKGWYKKSDDIVSDLIKCIEADGYMPSCKADVASLILTKCGNHLNNLSAFSNLATYTSGISPSESWKTGYRCNLTPNPWRDSHEDYSSDYDIQMAVIYYCLSSLAFIDRNQWVQKRPSGEVLKTSRSKVVMDEYSWTN